MTMPRLRLSSLLPALLLAACAAGSRPALAADEAPRVIRGSGASATGDGRLAWNELAPALAQAKRVGKPVLVDVYTDWCGWCKRMAKVTYGDADVRDYVAREFIPARVNAEDDAHHATYAGENVSYRQFADGFRISRYPTTLFLASDGTLITQLPGYVKPNTYMTVLHYVAEGHYKTRTYEAYIRDGDTPQP